MSLPYLLREGEQTKLALPAERKVDYTRCHESLHGKFIGAEDPRLFFTNDGQPLMIYSQTGHVPNVCRALFVVDVRVVLSELGNAMAAAGWTAPVMFKEQTPLVREGQVNVEKNWAPFFGDKDEVSPPE